MNSGEIEYIVKKSARTKRALVSVNARGEVVITLPKFVPSLFAKQIIVERKEWIEEQLEKIKESQIGDPRLFNYSREQYEKYREEARNFCKERLEYWASKMNLEYNRIAIKDMKTRWGSCSSKKNLNFNYKIIFLTDAQADYLIVHELAHLREMNHSKAFWNIVEKYVPQYKYLRTALRKSI